MDSLKMHSKDITEENIKKIAALFPNCVTEATDEQGLLRKKIDFDLLRQELSREIVEGSQERYQLNWPGKRQALLTANAPIAKTLRPYREESVDFDTTQNLFIEGDNLEALKLLQETYLGKVKMIYIDPPYNTGNDFIYKDDFSTSKEVYRLNSGQQDTEGNKLVANTDSNGRFHSDWLSMMYSRLKLARNLLDRNGVIFISIDENEFSNTIKLCNEIYGEENFIGNIVWKNVTDNNPTNIATEHEYIVVYAKSKKDLEKVWKSRLSDAKELLIMIGNELTSKFRGDELQKEYSTWFREHRHELWPLENYKFIDEQGVYSGERGVHNPGKEGYKYDILHPKTKLPCKKPLMGYRFPEETMKKMIDEGRIIFGDDENKLVEIKVYAKDYKQKLSSVLNLDGRTGANELKEIFPETEKIFTNPKTIKLLTEIISFATNDGDIVLDFFSGSGSTAHAILSLNSYTGENRKFIAIQLDELTYSIKNGKELANKGTAGEAFKHGFRSIADIAKERIRRVGKKLVQEKTHKRWSKDIGFRVLKVDSSNMADVYYTSNTINQDLVTRYTDNLKPDRTPEDLLFQVLLDWGVDLTLPITKKIILDHEVFFVDEDALVACFDNNGKITEEFVKELTQYSPLRVVFRDAGFASDSVKINVTQIFKQLSPHTEVKTI